MQNIIVGIDGTDTSKKAATEAMRVAEAFGATLHFVTVERKREVTKVASGSDHWIIDNLDQAKERVAAFVDQAGFEGDHTVVALAGQTSKALVKEAKRIDADLIVVGNADTGGLQGLLGSVSSGVQHHAPCNVLVVKTR